MKLQYLCAVPCGFPEKMTEAPHNQFFWMIQKRVWIPDAAGNPSAAEYTLYIVVLFLLYVKKFNRLFDFFVQECFPARPCARYGTVEPERKARRKRGGGAGRKKITAARQKNDRFVVNCYFFFIFVFTEMLLKFEKRKLYSQIFFIFSTNAKNNR